MGARARNSARRAKAFLVALDVGLVDERFMGRQLVLHPADGQEKRRSGFWGMWCFR